MPSAPGHRPYDRLQQALPAAIALFGLGLRLFELTRQSLWDDEVSQIIVTVQRLGVIWTRMAEIDSNPMLSYTLLKIWMAVFPESDFSLRMFSVLLGAASVGLVYLLAAQLVGRAEALLAELLAAISPMLVFLSQELRYNALVIALVLGAQVAFIRLLRRGKAGAFVACALCGIGAVYTHYFAWLAVGSFGLLALVRGWNASRLAGREARQAAAGMRYAGLGLAAIALIVLSYAPWIKTFLLQFFKGTPWRAPLPLARGLFELVAQLLFTPTPDRTFGLIEPLRRLIDSAPHTYHVFAALALLPMCAAVLIGALLLRRASARPSELLALLSVPVLGVLAAAVGMHVYEARYAAPYLPLALILISVALVGLWRQGRVGRVVCLALGGYIALTQGLSLREYYFLPDYARQDWRGAARLIESQEADNDFIAYYHLLKGLPLNRYYQGRSEQHWLIGYNEWDLPDAVYLPRCQELARTVSDADGTLWLVDYHHEYYDPPGPDGRTRLERVMAEWGYVPRVVHCERYGLRRFCIKHLVRAPDEVLAGFGSVVDFSGKYDPLQLGEGWFPETSNGFKFMGQQAGLKLRDLAAPGAARISVEIYVASELLAGPVRLTLLVDGAIVAQASYEASGIYTLVGTFDSAGQGGLIDVRLEADRFFVPERVGFPGDSSHKSIQVRRVAVEPAS